MLDVRMFLDSEWAHATDRLGGLEHEAARPCRPSPSVQALCCVGLARSACACVAAQHDGDRCLNCLWADADGGINNQGHNGYVRDCTSLGPDVVPGARDVPRPVMPVALKVMKGGKTLKGAKAAPPPPTPTQFYNSMQ